jgi:hypothetical protein
MMLFRVRAMQDQQLLLWQLHVCLQPLGYLLVLLLLQQ